MKDPEQLALFPDEWTLESGTLQRRDGKVSKELTTMMGIRNGNKGGVVSDRESNGEAAYSKEGEGKGRKTKRKIPRGGLKTLSRRRTENWKARTGAQKKDEKRLQRKNKRHLFYQRLQEKNTRAEGTRDWQRGNT